MIQIIEVGSEAFNEVIRAAAMEGFKVGVETGKKLLEDEIGGVQEAAKWTGLAVQTIYNKVDKGEIPYSKNSGKLCFSKKELQKWALKK